MALSNSSENRDGTPNIVPKQVIKKSISYIRLVLICLYLGNLITSLDFSPNGETEATIDRYGVCLISDVNTDSYHFHLNMKVEPFYGGKTLSSSFFLSLPDIFVLLFVIIS